MNDLLTVKNICVDCDGWTKRDASFERLKNEIADAGHVVTTIKLRGAEVKQGGGSLKRLIVDVTCETVDGAVWVKLALG